MTTESSNPERTVYIVDDDVAVRDSLSILLRLHGYRAVAFPSGEAFVASLDGPRTPEAGVVLLDLRLPGLGGPQVQAELAARRITWPVVILTAHGDAASARNALKAGASDFIEKPVEESVLLAALEHGARLQRDLESEAARKADLERRLARLTPREREVMAMVVEGRHNREVAQVLGISPRTVEVYKARVMQKLDVDRLPDLIRLTLT
ncbi:MAG: response regulator transcription factor [Proteobacteria bacterium]|nr:response regulator transcription factor [Pseudomonadota bacterium]